MRSFVTGTDAEVAAAGGVVDAVRNVVVFQRYVHAHVRGELEALLAEAAADVGGGLPSVPAPPLEDARPQEDRDAVPLPATVAAAAAAAEGTTVPPRVRLLSSWWDRDNWCIVAERV